MNDVWRRMRGGWGLVLAAVLAACGGGGGGSSGGGGADASFSVTFDRSSVSATWELGQAPSAPVVNAFGTGRPSSTVFVGATTPSGQPDPNVQQVEVLVDPSTLSALLTVRPTATLAPGRYSGRLVLLACPDNTCARTYAGTPFTLDYSFTVSVPALQAAEGAPLVVGSDTDLATLVGSTPVTLAGGGSAPTLTWTATTTTPWLRLVKSTGSVGESVSYQVDRTALAALARWQDHVGTIEIAVPGAPNTPQVRVTLRKELAELAFAGPGRIAANRAATVIVGGRGLDRLVVPRVSASGGLVPGAVSLRGTRGLALQLPPLPAGRYVFSIDNTLGEATSQAVLDVVSTTPLPQLPLIAAGTGTPRTVLYDEVARTAWVADLSSTPRVRRLRAAGTTWQVDELPLPGLLDIGLTPTADRLVAATTAGITVIDTTSLAVLSTTAAPQALTVQAPTGHGLPVMHDGSVWLAAGSQNFSRALVFSLLDSRFTEPAGSFSFYNGPWYVSSRDREHLLVVQTASLSPQPPALLATASVGMLAANANGVGFFYDAHISDDGSRIAIGGFDEVRDAALGLVGALPPPPAGTVGVRVVVSPDGRWTYRLVVTDNGGPPGSRTATVQTFDSSAQAPVLPIRGQSNFSADETCGTATLAECLAGPVTITPDGQHLVWAGPSGLRSVPLPSGLTSATAAAPRPAQAPLWLRQVR